jgi:8-oxo-dGTP pyrophosphatase MutT (NUDIX family)
MPLKTVFFEFHNQSYVTSIKIITMKEKENKIQIFFDYQIIYLSSISPNEIKNIDNDYIQYAVDDEKDLEFAIKLLQQNKNQIIVLYLVNSNLEKLKKIFFTYFTFVIAAGGVVRNSKNEIVIIKRNNIWDLPKGHMKKGEEKTDCALREVEEECGIDDLKIVKYIETTYHIYQSKGVKYVKETHWYEMSSNFNRPFKPQTDEDITEVKWIKQEDISDYINHTYSSLISVFNHFLLKRN